ncbi:hypothetical protein PROFUN_05766 [Planoprotostelium fungivorum]|uniref:C2H2-type domain-containing protein n=1 Tax=Planoprotostelium fungivorum TaxID=1890364 RepID=A0A2P6NPX2_9EUKA|nr:hypothetical protein PROFUN_05766 [Planoprotostelium fungivorum]
MGKKKKKEEKPYCWYCLRTFDDEKVLIQHQRAQHFKCHLCNRKLSTAGGMTSSNWFIIHRVPRAKPGRDSIKWEISGMTGIPDDEEAGVEPIDSNKKQKTDSTPAALSPAQAAPRITPPVPFSGPPPVTGGPGPAIPPPNFGYPPMGGFPMYPPPMQGMGPGYPYPPPMMPQGMPPGPPIPIGPPMGMPPPGVPPGGLLYPPSVPPPYASSMAPLPPPVVPFAPITGVEKVGVSATPAVNTPQTILVYDDEMVSMEEKRATLIKYRQNDDSIKEKLNRMDNSIESRLAVLGDIGH